MDYYDFEHQLILSVDDGKRQIVDLFNNLTQEQLNTVHSYTKELDSHIKLKLPGYKTNLARGIVDYCFEYNGKSLSHGKICQIIYSYVLNGVIHYNKCCSILQETFIDGLYYCQNESDSENELRKILFWVSLQEEINYPLKYNTNGTIKRYGRLLAFCRYAEALGVAHNNNSSHNIEEVYQRANNHGKQVPLLWNLYAVPSYYTEALSRQRIN